MAVLQDININVHGQPSEKRLQTFLRLSQNENGRMINFRVLGPPLPSNCTATFSGTKPDGNVYSKTGTVAGNFVIIQEDMQMTAVAGVWDAKLDIINGSHNIMTALIRVVIDADVVDPDAIASDSQLQGLVAEAKYYAEHARTDAYGSPLTAPTKAQMTDHTRVYVYTGSEPNMVAGNWYHWNGTAWISGGVYNSVAVQSDSELNDFSTNPVQNKVIKAALDQIEGAIPEIDATLSVAGKAADGKATGDAVASLKEDLNATTGLINGIPSVTNFIDSKSIASGTGIENSASTNFKSTDYVEIPEGATTLWVTMRIAASYSNLGLAFYNSSKTYISGVREHDASAKGWEYRECTVPEGAVYFRSTWYGDADTTVHPAFNVYTDKSFEMRLDDMQTQIDDAIIQTDALSFINVYDPNADDIEVGYEIASNGNKTANSVMMISGFIPCVELEHYTFPVYLSHFGTSAASYLACYNGNKEWVRSVQGTRSGNILDVGIPKYYGIKYFRVNICKLDANSNYIETPFHSRSNFMVIKGRTMPSRFIPYIEQKLMDGSVYSAHENLNNPLYGKKVVFLGDSICEASTDDQGGFAQRIGMANTMLWENAGIGGSTIAVTGANKTICTREIKMTDPDYIILEGGTNDADRIGTATGETKPANFGTYDPDDYGTDDASTYYGFDINTFCGACDYMCKRFVSMYAGAKIGFIGAHKMGQVLATRKNRGYYIQTAMDICKKWGIPVLDLWNGSYLNPMIPAHYTSGEDYLYADGQHLYPKGYAYITPMIEAFMKSL